MVSPACHSPTGRTSSDDDIINTVPLLAYTRMLLVRMKMSFFSEMIPAHSKRSPEKSAYINAYLYLVTCLCHTRIQHNTHTLIPISPRGWETECKMDIVEHRKRSVLARISRFVYLNSHVYDLYLL